MNDDLWPSSWSWICCLPTHNYHSYTIQRRELQLLCYSYSHSYSHSCDTLISWDTSSLLTVVELVTFSLSKSSSPRCTEYSICILRCRNFPYLMMLVITIYLKSTFLIAWTNRKMPHKYHIGILYLQSVLEYIDS